VEFRGDRVLLLDVCPWKLYLLVAGFAIFWGTVLSDRICIKANKIKKRSTGAELGHVIYALLASARFTE
jgi:hypothetical protein